MRLRSRFALLLHGHLLPPKTHDSPATVLPNPLLPAVIRRRTFCLPAEKKKDFQYYKSCQRIKVRR